MKRMLAIMFLCAAFSPSVFAQATAKFVGVSTTNTFGSDGSFLPVVIAKAPPYATLAASMGAFSWTWPSGITCWYNAAPFALTLDTSGGQHEITLWVLDYDKFGRTETLEIKDAASGIILDSETASNFQSGLLLSWIISGNVQVEVVSTGPVNGVLSGIYFNPPPGSSPTTTAAAPVHNVSLSWTAVSNATSYNIYKNSALLTSTGSTSYTDANVPAGSVITYGIAAVVGGTAGAVVNSTVTVPTP
jgi:hypothetical protein